MKKRLVFKKWLDYLMKGSLSIEISILCMINDFTSFRPILILIFITIINGILVYKYGRDIERL